jgi:hypothetical protein
MSVRPRRATKYPPKSAWVDPPHHDMSWLVDADGGGTSTSGQPKTRGRGGALVLTGLVLLSLPTLAWAQKTDVVIMVNGDRVTCEIVRLERGILEAKTDSWGTLSIEWEEVASVASARRFEVHRRNGERLFGTLGTAAVEGQVVVNDGTDATYGIADLVFIKPVGSSLWGQLDGAFDVGYSYASAGAATQWSLSADVTRTREGSQTRLSGDSFFSSKEGAEDTSRHSLSADYVRYVGRHWGVIVIGQGQRNDEIRLKFRGQGGAGGIYRFVQTNHAVFSAFAGAIYNYEVFTDETESSESWELMLGSQFEWFVFNSPKTRVSNFLAMMPSLTTSGRVRVELNSSVRRELFKDFFVNLSLLESYDSKPPSEDARKNDLTLVTSIGWSF